MSSIDQQFVEYIVTSLVNNPDDVKVERTIDEKGVLLSLTVNPEDLGRVIGKRGSTAQSIRTLLRALGTKNDARYNLKIIDPEGGRPPRRDDSDQQADDKPAAEPDDDQPNEDRKPKKAKENQPAEEVLAPEVAETPAEETPQAESKDSLADKTRKELAELDDLDI